MAVTYTKWPYIVATSSIARPSTIYPNWGFLVLKKMPSGNPASG
jgi:hypothetical protein